MRSIIAYTVSRVLLFVVAYGVLYLLGATGGLALILAVLVSGLVSYILLAEQRDAISAAIVGRQERRQSIGDRLAQGAAKEDGSAESAEERSDTEEPGTGRS